MRNSTSTDPNQSRYGLCFLMTLLMTACGSVEPEPKSGGANSSEASTEEVTGDEGVGDSTADMGSDSGGSSGEVSVEDEPDGGGEAGDSAGGCEAFCSESIRTAIGECLLESDNGPVDYSECLEVCQEDGYGTLTDCMNQAGTNCQAVEACFEAMDEQGGGELPSTASSFEISALNTAPLSNYFSKYTTVFGVFIVATSATPDAKVLHAANIMAEYLDNNEDGLVDDPEVVDILVRKQAVLVMFATQDEAESSGIFETDVLDGYAGQDLYGEETNPVNGFDASLEEVLHLISSHGYEEVYPEALSSEGTSLMTQAMDLARGGHFTTIPSQYPESAWYHYDDTTCDYRCMAVEYFYWALTTKLGAQAETQRCNEIRVEWELCTPAQLESGDVAMFEILSNPQYKLPTVLPDGNYEGLSQ